MDPTLVIATADHQRPRIAAIESGQIRIDGWTLRNLSLVTGENVILQRAFNDPGFGAAELSLSKFAILHARQECPFVGLPVFIARSFRQGDLYVHARSGIATPGDLRGRRVGCGDPRHTAHVWARMMLQDEFGVAPDDIRWVVGHRERAYDHPADAPALPSGTVLADHASLSDMLARGEIDALLSPIPPSSLETAGDAVRRLFADPRPPAAESYRYTGIYPILHLVGLRHELAAAHPGLAVALTQALTQAKSIWQAGAQDDDSLWRRSVMGPDIYPYGLGAANWRMLDLFLTRLRLEGLIDRPLRPEDLFAPDTLAPALS